MIRFLFLAIALTACGDTSYQEQAIDQPASNALVPANPINHPVVCDGDVCVQFKEAK